MRANSPHTHLLILASILFAGQARGIILYGTDDPGANTTAPTGLYESAGWGWQGLFGSFLGTMIGPQHFITAQHIGNQGGTFLSSALFNGIADVAYQVDTSANGGLGYWDIAGTDLRIFKIQETFSSYAPLYDGANETGLEMMIFGRGGMRGAEVSIGLDLKGWRHQVADGVPRWGLNEVSGVMGSPYGSLLRAEFNAGGGPHEATLSAGDSGGAVFVLDGGVWKLAGINFSVDGFFDTNAETGDGSHFGAALFDRGGLYQGSDSGGWTLISDTETDAPSQMYASRIAPNVSEIQGITLAPEPSGAMLLAAAAMLCLRRRSRPVSWQKML